MISIFTIFFTSPPCASFCFLNKKTVQKKITYEKPQNFNSKNTASDVLLNQTMSFIAKQSEKLSSTDRFRLNEEMIDILREKIDIKFDLNVRLYETERNFVEYPI